MLRRSASASNADQSTRPPAAASKSPSRHRGGRRLQTRLPSRRASFAGPAHSHNRMTLAIYTRATEGLQDSETTALEVTFLDPAVDTPLSNSSGSSAGPLTFSAICR
jgi:hypothetical protein